MLALVGCTLIGLVAVNLWLVWALVRLRRRTRRLAVLARAEARRVRSIDGATSAAFEHVHALLAERRGREETHASPPRPMFPN